MTLIARDEASAVWYSSLGSGSTGSDVYVTGSTRDLLSSGIAFRASYSKMEIVRALTENFRSQD